MWTFIPCFQDDRKECGGLAHVLNAWCPKQDGKKQGEKRRIPVYVALRWRWVELNLESPIWLYFPGKLRQELRAQGGQSYISCSFENRLPCKGQNQYTWHLALRKPVSQAGLWSIISLSRLAWVQPGRRAGSIQRDQSQLAGSGTAELQACLLVGCGGGGWLEGWSAHLLPGPKSDICLLGTCTERPQKSMDTKCLKRRNTDVQNHQSLNGIHRRFRHFWYT